MCVHLLRKLHLYGLAPLSIDFIRSYINSRVQCTKVNEYTSTEAKPQCGTAQGSILGPLFFILFMNDIFSYVTYNNNLTMYAEDTVLIEQGATEESSVKACQKWCNLNKLTVNIDKTKIMTIAPGLRNNDQSLFVNIACKNLQRVHKYEYLGVIMD